jgi:hypothetical protein
MFIFQFDFEHGIRQRFNHRCHHLNRVFFAHALLGFFVTRVPSLRSGFRQQAPASLTPA